MVCSFNYRIDGEIQGLTTYLHLRNAMKLCSIVESDLISKLQVQILKYRRNDSQLTDCFHY